MTQAQKNVGIYLVEAAELLNEIEGVNDKWVLSGVEVIEVAKMLQIQYENSSRADTV